MRVYGKNSCRGGLHGNNVGCRRHRFGNLNSVDWRTGSQFRGLVGLNSHINLL
jgi:hypothetical protein